jgi:hypothetical protein
MTVETLVNGRVPVKAWTDQIEPEGMRRER